MTAFRVAITRIWPPREGRAKYLVTLSTEVIERQWATMMPVSDDTALHNTMAKLGISEPQQGRIQSLLNEGHDQVLNVEIPEQIAADFGWAEKQ
jgi:hypothetical protein